MIRLFIVALGVLSCGPSHAQTLAAPFSTYTYVNPTISSWFGPRYLSSSFEFHQGVDYGQSPGTPVVAVESGTVTNIRYDAPHGGGYFVEITGATGIWRYLHTFSNNGGVLPVRSGNGPGAWTLSCDNGSSFCLTGHLSISRPKIVFSTTVSYSTRTIDTTSNNQVDSREPFVPVGTSGGVAPHFYAVKPHLHLAFLSTSVSLRSNPLQYVTHTKGPPVIRVLSPLDGSVFGSTSSLTNYLLSAQVDATAQNAGKDVDIVDFLIDGTVQPWNDSVSHTFQFGGMASELRLGATVYSTSNGVAPVLNGTFSPFFNLTLDISDLGDGSHQFCVQSANVNNGATNQACGSFIIDTSNPSGSNLNTSGGANNQTTANPLVVTASAAVSGIQSITVSGPGFYSSTSFNCPPTAKVGPLMLTSSGTYTIVRTNCAGTSTSTAVNLTTAAAQVTVSGTGPTGTQSTSFAPDLNALGQGTSTITIRAGFCDIPSSYLSLACLQAHASGPGSSSGCGWVCVSGPCCWIQWQFYSTGLSGGGFTITNTTTTPVAHDLGLSIDVAVSRPGGVDSSDGSISFPYLVNDGDAVNGSIIASPVGQPQPINSGPAHSTSTISGVNVSQCVPANNIFQQLLAQLLASILPGQNPYCWSGSEAVFTSSAPMSFTFQEPTGVVIDTMTLGIYGYDIPSGLWTMNMAVNQSVNISSMGFVVVSGSFTRTGSYGVYFQGHDSSAPVTTFSIQGSSFVFDQTLFVSTYSYAVLTATDPVVNGFASQVATITYCLDPSSGSVFSVYTSSIPLPLGTHIFQYRSYDYAGNAEAVNTATFTVTAGTAFKEQSDDAVAGNLLVGFLGSGAQAEVVARAQDSTTLQVSSANHQPMLAVTNIGNVGVGVPVPFGQLDIGSSNVALQLKSGNLTSTGTSVEIAFGDNGDVSMRHALRTFHSTATVGNEMDFLVWTPDAGSTTTIATSKLLALQAITTASGGSMHVVPSGTPDVELEVSNGSSTGGGTMQRLQVLTPSSKRFKYDISYLNEKDEDRALEETSALKHVRYRYRSRAKDGSLYDDPIQQVRVGLIYEEAPDSIRGEGQTLLTNERLANIELALKAAIRKLELLDKRYKDLKARMPR